MAGVPRVVTGKRCPEGILEEDAESLPKHQAERAAAPERRKRGKRPSRTVR
jgi:hypothetical protein